MSLKHAILGLLTVMPMTGYDLKNRAFDTTIAHFWKADQSQIYRTLNQLSDNGWVQSEIQAQDERPDRKVYSITETGRAELVKWLQKEQKLPVTRDPFLVQLFFAGHLDNDAILGHIERQRQAHEAKLQQYQQIEMPQLGDPELDRTRLFWRLTLEMGIATEQNYLDWLAQCETIVRALGESSDAKSNQENSDET